MQDSMSYPEVQKSSRSELFSAGERRSKSTYSIQSHIVKQLIVILECQI